MKEQELTTSEKLHMLLDGETDGIDTSEVFFKLSNEPELQEEFVQTVKMKKIMKDLPESPPDHLKKGVLAGIGLSGGLTYYLQGSSLLSGAASFITSKIGVAVSSLLLGSFLTFSVIDSNDKNENPNTDNKETSSLALADLKPKEMDIPVISSRDSDADTKNIPAVSETENNIENKKSESVSSANVTKSANKASTDFRDLTINSSPDQYANKYYLSNFESDNHFVVKPTHRILNNYYDESQMLFSLQVRGLSGKSIKDFDISRVEAPLVNDIGIALMYSVNEDVSVGMEFGQEFLVQKVQGGSFNNNEYIDENLLTFWGGLKAAYTFNDLEIIDNLKPTSSILMGGTNNGWIGKASAGLVYDISRKLAFYGGPEWTTLFYKNQENILTSHKWGVYYGISIKF